MKRTIELPYEYGWMMQLNLHNQMKQDWNTMLAYARLYEIHMVSIEQSLDYSADIILALWKQGIEPF